MSKEIFQIFYEVDKKYSITRIIKLKGNKSFEITSR